MALFDASVPADPARSTAVEFALDLPVPEITDEVRAYAAPSFWPGRPLADVIVDLTHRIFTAFRYLSGSTTVSTTVVRPVWIRRTVPTPSVCSLSRHEWSTLGAQALIAAKSASVAHTASGGAGIARVLTMVAMGRT